MDLSKIDNDFTDDEVEKINTFVSNGCIGLEGLVKDEHKVNGLFGLYMSGKTYIEISKISRVKKDLVLYMSAKQKWYEKRMEYLDDIQKNMVKKLTDTRLQSLNFIASLISVHHKYYGEEMNEYLRTGDRTIIENLDLKQLSQYFKSIELLEKILNPTNVKTGGGSNMNVNVSAPDGATLTQVDEKTLEIKPGNTGSVLEALAKHKEEQKNKDS
jgi:hypothetical protein